MRKKFKSRARLLGVICLVMALLLAPQKTASADPGQTEPLPQCVVFETTAGIEVCGYTSIIDVRAIARADVELVFLRGKVKALQSKSHNLAGQIRELGGALEAQRGATKIARSRNTSLATQLVETDLKWQRERVKPRISIGGIWWAVVGAVVGGSAIGLAAYSVAR